jgi:flagellar basal-body rod protein FlgG
MLQATKTAAMAVNAQQKRIDIIADNLANINTFGYKSVRADFKDALYQIMLRPVQPQNNLNLLKGHGVLLSATNRNFISGAMLNTGLNTDFFLDGKGFFAVRDANGQISYTRDGGFKISNENNENFLTTQDGAYILDINGNRIRIQGKADDIRVNAQGMISEGDNPPYAQIAVYSFINTNGLDSIGSSRFIATAASGQPEADNTTGIRQGYVENSNVELADEMTKVIRAQRALQLASRALTTADQMDALAIGIRN